MKALIVDDNTNDRKLLRIYLEKHGYSVVEAENGKAGLRAAASELPDLIVSDVLMPEMDGFRMLRELRKGAVTRGIPFIFHSAVYTDAKDEALAKSLGADAFIVKPKEPDQFWLELTAALKAEAKKGGKGEQKLLEEDEIYLDRYSQVVASRLEEKVKELETANAALARANEVIKRSLEGTVSAIAIIAERRDPYTAGHEVHVSGLAEAIAVEMGLEDDIVEGLKIAAVLHDVGKMYVPAEILSKPGRLSELEFRMIKVHPQFSYDILKNVDFPWPVADISLQHHERMDGSGYPNGLAGDDILVEARILAVADVVEAMSSHRPYRPAHSIEDALNEIESNKGKLFDPAVVDAALGLFASGFKLVD